MGGQFPPAKGGQFASATGGQFDPKLVVSLNWNQVVNFTVFSTPSPHSAFIAVFVMQNEEPIKLMNFETDLGVITDTIEFVISGRYFRYDPRPNAHAVLVRIIMDDNEPKVDLNTIIINFICYYEAELSLERFPNQSIGYFLYLDIDDLSRCHLEGGMMADMVEWYSKIIGYSLEDPAA